MYDICFSPTQHCNLSCAYCYLGAETPDEASPVSRAQQVVAMLQQEFTAPGRVTIIGAESLMLGAEKLGQLIELFHAFSGYKVVVSTNGTLLDEAYLTQLEQVVPDLISKVKFSISLDGPASIHDQQRQGYRQAKQAVDLVWTRGYALAIPICLTTQTWEQFGAFEEWLQHEVEAKGIPYQLKFIYGDSPFSFSGLSTTQQQEFARWLYRTKRYTYVQNLNANMCYRGGTKCTGLEFAHTGEVYTCNRTAIRGREVANWLTNSMVEIRAARKRYWNAKTLAPQCLSCALRELCNGGCPEEREAGQPAIDCAMKLELARLFASDGLDFVEWFFSNTYLAQTTEPQVGSLPRGFNVT